MTTSFLTDDHVHLLTEGTYPQIIYEKLGAHVTEQDGTAGTHFAVWAPNAQAVSVIGDFNGWQPEAHPMRGRGPSGLWACFVPGIGSGALYRYAITSRHENARVTRLDPCGFAAVLQPQLASKVWDLSGHAWGDQEWLARRARAQGLEAPIAIYEVHLGSWRRVPEEGNRWLTYREMAPLLAEYVHQLGATHVELLPVSEYPPDESWGYQTIGYFAPTSRFGTPQDFMFLIDTLHRQGIGVILDWLPAHFPRHEYGLAHFDGTPLYENRDARQEGRPDGATGVFDYGRPEVSAFLIGNALFWLDHYHIDGLRVDAVASMLYPGSSRTEGAGAPSAPGEQENPEASAFLRRCNERIHAVYPGVLTVAEESTAWQVVLRPTLVGGLGFDLKWDSGWTHDTLGYLALEPLYRKHYHDRLTLRMLHAFTDHHVLPLSHGEVVHGKRSLLAQMPGDDWQKFANLRLLFGYQVAQPGKKLLFMGDEFGPWNAWNADASLDWHLLDGPRHQGLQRWVRDLNTFYRGEPACHQLDCDPTGFEWVDTNDAERSVLSFVRKGKGPDDVLLVVANFTPVPRYNYRVGVSQKGRWEEVLNSDAPLYGGSGQGNLGGVATAPISWHGRTYALNLTLPPLAIVVFKRSSGSKEAGPVVTTGTARAS